MVGCLLTRGVCYCWRSKPKALLWICAVDTIAIRRLIVMMHNVSLLFLEIWRKDSCWSEVELQNVFIRSHLVELFHEVSRVSSLSVELFRILCKILKLLITH